MGSLVGCCIRSVCCIGTGCCIGCCFVCSKCGAIPRVFARIAYVCFALFWIVVSIIFLFYGNYIFSVFNGYLGCPKDSNLDSCIQISAVYRTSLTLAIFHLVLFLICLFKSKVSSAIHEGVWPIKFLVVIGIFIGTLFITNSFFKGYGYFAMVMSFFFLVYEMILLIEIAYSWNKMWIGQYEQSSEKNSSEYTFCWAAIIITGTIIFYSGGLIICILLFIYYHSIPWHIADTSLTIVFGIAFSIISVSPIVKSGGSLFTCSLVFLFTSCLCASSILSDPSIISPGVMTSQIFIGLAFMFLVLFYVSATTIDESKQGTVQLNKL